MWELLIVKFDDLPKIRYIVIPSVLVFIFSLRRIKIQFLITEEAQNETHNEKCSVYDRCMWGLACISIALVLMAE